MKASSAEAAETPTFLDGPEVAAHSVHLKAREVFFTQGGAADSVFYLQAGRARLTVVSAAGKEATITMLGPGDFIGEEAVAGAPGRRMATAAALVPCAALKVMRPDMLRLLREYPAVSERFLKFLLARSMRTQADLVDQLFNCSERRLARILLLLAGFDTSDALEVHIAPITQETLAAMVGTTRSRVNFFMNRFRKLGLIDYNGHIRVHKSLSHFLLQDAVPLPVDPFAAATGAATERSSPPKSTRPKRPTNQPTHPTPPPV
jgi:CRP-like cAMP-binding protein